MPIHHSSMYRNSRYRESIHDHPVYSISTYADSYADADDDPVETSSPDQSSLWLWLKPPPGILWALLDAIAWIVGAVLLRLNVERWFMMQGTISAWVCGIAILIAPALILIHISTRCPNHRGLIIYRSLILMFGLLLGGRL